MIAVDLLSASTLVVALGVFLGAFVAGFAGFGLAAAAGAFLLHVLEPKLAVPLMMICSVCAQCAGLVYLRKSMNVASALPFIMGGLAGVPFAIMILREIEGEALRTGFGAFLIAYSSWALLSLYGVTRRITVGTEASADGAPPIPAKTVSRTAKSRDKAIVGLFAGIVGGLTAMPGALLSIWADARRLSKVEQRGFVQPFILAMQLTALALMLPTPGLLTRDVLSPLYVSVLPLVVGTFLGLYLYGRASAGVFRLGVLAIVFTSGCGLVVR